jgi:hypothetical protein
VPQSTCDCVIIAKKTHCAHSLLFPFLAGTRMAATKISIVKNPVRNGKTEIPYVSGLSTTRAINNKTDKVIHHERPVLDQFIPVRSATAT